VEYLTNELAEKAWSLICEVEELGGMTLAIETGLPKIRIEEASARKQARIDSEQDGIIGLNLYKLQNEDELQILEVDNVAVRKLQIERLTEIKKTRNISEVEKALKNLLIAAKEKMTTGLPNTSLSGERQNLLALAVEAARVRATLGEITSILEEAFG